MGYNPWGCKESDTTERLSPTSFFSSLPLPLAGPEEESGVIEHLTTGTELWVKVIDDTNWAEIYSDSEEETLGYVNLVDMAALLLPENMAEFPIRTIQITNSLDEMPVMILGEEVELSAELINFETDDQYTIAWQYTPDHGETYGVVEGANETTYRYILGYDNLGYGYRIVVTLQPKE